MSILDRNVVAECPGPVVLEDVHVPRSPRSRRVADPARGLLDQRCADTAVKVVVGAETRTISRLEPGLELARRDVHTSATIERPLHGIRHRYPRVTPRGHQRIGALCNADVPEQAGRLWTLDSVEGPHRLAIDSECHRVCVAVYLHVEHRIGS